MGRRAGRRGPHGEAGVRRRGGSREGGLDLHRARPCWSYWVWRGWRGWDSRTVRPDPDEASFFSTLCARAQLVSHSSKKRRGGARWQPRHHAQRSTTTHPSRHATTHRPCSTGACETGRGRTHTHAPAWAHRQKKNYGQVPVHDRGRRRPGGLPAGPMPGHAGHQHLRRVGGQGKGGEGVHFSAAVFYI